MCTWADPGPVARNFIKVSEKIVNAWYIMKCDRYKIWYCKNISLWHGRQRFNRDTVVCTLYGLFLAFGKWWKPTVTFLLRALPDKNTHSTQRQTYIKTSRLKGSFSCKWVKKSIFFFHHYSIAYAFRNTHVKFQGGIRKIVEVMNFFVTSCSTSGFWHADFKRVFLETMFFKLACTINEEQLDIFQKFSYRIKLY